MANGDGGWTTKRSRTVVETAWLRVREDQIELPDGDDITYTWIDYGGYVVVLPIDDEERVVMEHVYRHPLGRTLLECPSGGCDGEDAITAGRRELEEETGLRADSWTSIGAFYGASGHSNERFEVVVARGLREDGRIARENTEQIELERIPLAELHARALRGELEDAPSALAILLYVARERS